MHHVVVLVLLACVAAVTCNDVKVGTAHGRLVVNETIHAAPAIWRQRKSFTANVTEDEVISGVIVQDQRPYKDGSAKILEGGKGHKTVTVELQSPSVLRGFDFHVTIYAVEEGQLQNTNAEDNSQQAQVPEVQTLVTMPVDNTQIIEAGQNPVQTIIEGQEPTQVTNDSAQTTIVDGQKPTDSNNVNTEEPKIDEQTTEVNKETTVAPVENDTQNQQQQAAHPALIGKDKATTEVAKVTEAQTVEPEVTTLPPTTPKVEDTQNFYIKGQRPQQHV